MSTSFLEVLKRRGNDGPLPLSGCGGPAEQGVRPGRTGRAWDFVHHRHRMLQPVGLWKQWANVLRMRRDGIPVLGFTWYCLTDQVDWDTQLAERHGRVNACGLYDMDRKRRPVAREYQNLIREFGGITALAHGELFDVTDRPAMGSSDV